MGKIIYNGKFGFGVNGVGANMYIDFTNDGSATKAVSATGSILTGTWYFVTMTRNGTTINLYVNGVLSGTANQTVEEETNQTTEETVNETIEEMMQNISSEPGITGLAIFKNSDWLSSKTTICSSFDKEPITS
ncbi:MAG: hypothetical protein UV49_C0035G0001, partial [candidate division WWE3 bacterium GW2011_GWA2_42_9]